MVSGYSRIMIGFVKNIKKSTGLYTLTWRVWEDKYKRMEKLVIGGEGVGGLGGGAG